ncbi:MAG: sugar ABC transporter ATP-binding protein [Pyrinomonadaceae bacterium]
MTNLLSLSGLGKRFGATVALDGVSLELRAGEVHALVGENGAGKSTLLNVLAGAITPDAGMMEVGGRVYAPASPLDARLRGVGLIHQELSLAPHLSVAENVLMGHEPSRLGWLDRKKLNERALAVLETFRHPEIRPDVRVGKLSVAARQIVEICRAVAARARIILMDEPTSSLQRADVARLFTLIRKLRDDGVGVIYISHFLEEVREIADRYTVLRDGLVAGTGEIGVTTDEMLIAQMVGRPVESLFPRRESSPAQDAETVLEVRDLCAPPLLRHASFDLQRGEILGVAGLLGSGRTPLVRALFGLERARSGEIKVKGRMVSPRVATPAARLSERLGYLSEDRKGEGLALALSVADNVTLTRYQTCSRRGWLDLARQRRQAETQTVALGVRARTVRQPVSTLSGGNQQKVALARLLHQDADILLLDEPTRGIDIGSKVQVYETIARCAAEGRAILFVSSYLPELFGMCDRLMVMSRGRLSPARAVAEWTPESVMRAAIGTESDATLPDARRN